MNRLSKVSVSQKNTRSTSKMSRRKFTPVSSAKKVYSINKETSVKKGVSKLPGKKQSNFKKIESKELKKELIGKSKRELFDFYCFTNQDQSAKLVPTGDKFDEKVIESAICDFVNGVLLISLRDLLSCQSKRVDNEGESNSGKERNLILLTRILSQIDDKYSITLLSKSQFSELQQYLVDFMIPYHSYKSKVISLVEKTLSREDAESLASKLTGEPMEGKTQMYKVLERIYEVKGIEKMLAFVFVQIIESFDIPFNIYMTEIRALNTGKKKKKVKFYDCLKSMDVKDQGVFILLKVTKGFIFYYGSKNVVRKSSKPRVKSYKSIEKHMSIRDLDLEISTNAETNVTYNNVESSKYANSSKISLSKFRRTEDLIISNCNQSNDINFFSKRDMIIGSSMDSERFGKEKDKAANSTKRVAVCLKEGENFNRSFDAPKRSHKKWQKDVLKRNSFIELYGKSARSILKKKFKGSREEKENKKKNNKIHSSKKKKKNNRDRLKGSKSSKKGCTSIEGSSNKNHSFNSSFMKLFSDKSQMNFKKKSHSKRKRKRNGALKENNLNITDFSHRIDATSYNEMKSFEENSSSKNLSQKMKAILNKRYETENNSNQNMDASQSFNKKAGKTQALIQRNQELIENLIEKYDVKKVSPLHPNSIYQKETSILINSKNNSVHQAPYQNNQRSLSRSKRLNANPKIFFNNERLEKAEQEESQPSFTGFKNIFANITNLTNTMDKNDTTITRFKLLSRFDQKQNQNRRAVKTQRVIRESMNTTNSRVSPVKNNYTSNPVSKPQKRNSCKYYNSIIQMNPVSKRKSSFSSKVGLRRSSESTNNLDYKTKLSSNMMLNPSVRKGSFCNQRLNRASNRSMSVTSSTSVLMNQYDASNASHASHASRRYRMSNTQLGLHGQGAYFANSSRRKQNSTTRFAKINGRNSYHKTVNNQDGSNPYNVVMNRKRFSPGTSLNINTTSKYFKSGKGYGK